MKNALLYRVQETIDWHRMLAAGERVILAVSGGIDSMLMLDVLLRLRSRYHVSLHVAHLNHNLRGTDSAAAADFVRNQCKAHQLPMTITTAEEEALRGHKGGSLQAAARILRYRFLEQVADEQGANRIALGHHRNDQAETVLMNLLRGSGVRGLGGIPPVRDRIIRPLIDCSREEIARYARQEGIPFVEDASNRDLSYSRNRIRLELLPELATRCNPRVVHALANVATILEAEDTALNAIVEKQLESVLISRSQTEVILSIPGMKTLPHAMRWRIVRRTAEGLREGRSGLTCRQTLEIDRLLQATSTQGFIQAPGGLRVSKAGDCLIMSVEGGRRGRRIVSFPLTVPGDTAIPGSSFCFRSELLEEWSKGELYSDGWTVLLDADRVGRDLHVRGWEAGDRFIPIGMSSQKKLQDFFVDVKVPRDQRGVIPLVLSGDRIAWVVGFRVDERFKVTASTRRVLRMHATAVVHGIGPY